MKKPGSTINSAAAKVPLGLPLHLSNATLNLLLPKSSTESGPSSSSNPNDYRGQEFPTGTASAINTQYLKFVRH
mgnify:CR=1 FL=1